MSQFIAQRLHHPDVPRYAYRTYSGLVVSTEPEPCHYPAGRLAPGAIHERTNLPQTQVPFHLFFHTSPVRNFLLSPQWGRDDYVYMAFLPTSLSCQGDPLLAPLHWTLPFNIDVSHQWHELQELLKSISDILLPHCCNHTLHFHQPPLLSQTHTFSLSSNIADDSSRRMCRSGRRVLWSWVAFVACQIAIIPSLPHTAPAWLRILRNDQAFPTHWLDRASMSPFLSGLPKQHRSGMIIDMSVHWAFLPLCDRFETHIPIWYLYPDPLDHCTSPFGRSLLPTPHLITSCAAKPNTLVPPPAPPSPLSILKLISQRQAEQQSQQESELAQQHEREQRLYGLTVADDDTPTPSSSHPGTFPQSSPLQLQHLDINHNTFPASSAQLPTENISDFFDRRDHDDTVFLTHQTPAERQQTQLRTETIGLLQSPYPSTNYFEWVPTLQNPPDYFRQPRDFSWAQHHWCDYDVHQMRYNPARGELDFCKRLAPFALPLPTHRGLCPSPPISLTPSTLHPPLDSYTPDMAELHQCAFTIKNMLPLPDLLRIRYGVALDPVFPTPTMPFHTAMHHLAEFVEDQGIDQSMKNSIAHFVQAVMDTPPSTDLPSPISPYLTKKQSNFWNLTTHPVTVLSPTSMQHPKFPNTAPPSSMAISAKDSPQLGVYIHITNWPTLKQALASGNRSLSALIEYLIRSACQFTLLSLHPIAIPDSIPISMPHSLRPRNHTFTQADYQSYILTRHNVLQHPAFALAALSTGSILWRLATESIDHHNLFNPNQPEKYVTAQHFSARIDNCGEAVGYTLPAPQVSILVGTYEDQDRQFIPPHYPCPD